MALGAVGLVALVAVIPYHFYESLVPKVIVVGLLVGVAGFTFFFVFKAVQETRYVH